MERRDFLKTGILTIFSLYGLSKNISCFAGDNISVAFRAVEGHHAFTGVYHGTLENGRVVLPNIFSRHLIGERIVLVVPEKNSPVMVFQEHSPYWEGIRQMFDEADKEGFSIFREHTEIDVNGNFYLSDRVRRYAGIQTPAIAIIGRGYAIEIIDSKRQALGVI